MKKLFLVVAILLVSFCVPPNAHCFSLAGDWSDSVNPNGPWSYNAGDIPLPYNVANWPLGEFGAQTAWANSNTVGTFIPGWFKSISNAQYDWLVGDVIVHSTDDVNGVNNGLANVTWTSPASGIYDINGGLWMGRDIGRSNDWNLYLEDDVLASGSLFTGDIYSRANPYFFNIQGVNIAEGSVLKMEFVKTSDFGEFIGVDLNINNSVVPEPATMLLFGTGLLGAVLRRRIG